MKQVLGPDTLLSVTSGEYQWETEQWAIQHSSGSAEDFHGRRFPSPLRPTAWFHTAHRPTLVLGSSQSDSMVDLAAAAQSGIDVCRRRSGGGLVYVDPTTSCWVDLLLPPGHLLWSDDVGQAFLWVGEAWRAALDACGISNSSVHRGRLLNRRAGRFVCFAGLGSGELTVGASKVVGLSQRRTSQGVRFQCLLETKWQPSVWLHLIRPGVIPAELLKEIHELRVGVPVSTVEAQAAFVAQLELAHSRKNRPTWAESEG